MDVAERGNGYTPLMVAVRRGDLNATRGFNGDVNAQGWARLFV